MVAMRSVDSTRYTNSLEQQRWSNLGLLALAASQGAKTPLWVTSTLFGGFGYAKELQDCRSRMIRVHVHANE